MTLYDCNILSTLVFHRTDKYLSQNIYVGIDLTISSILATCHACQSVCLSNINCPPPPYQLCWIFIVLYNVQNSTYVQLCILYDPPVTVFLTGVRKTLAQLSRRKISSKYSNITCKIIDLSFHSKHTRNIYLFTHKRLTVLSTCTYL